MTKKQLDTLLRDMTRVREQTIRLTTRLTGDPDIADHVTEAANALLAALRMLESDRDDVDAVVPA